MKRLMLPMLFSVFSVTAESGIEFLFAPQVAGGTAPYAVEIVDVDGDLDRDVITSNSADDDRDNISVIKNNGDGTFAAPVHYEVGETR
ncbi:MAG: hypothetical protein ACR2HJ_03700 [Fimbriimonadales bacterium]